MSEQTGNETPAPSAEVTPEAAPAQTATPETGTETAQEQKETPPATKTFSQDEVNDIVKRAKAATESKTERRILRTLEQLQRPTQQTQETSSAPSRREGEAEDDYIERLVEEKLSRRSQQERAQTVAQKTDDLYTKATAIQGFDRDVFDSLPLTKTMAEALAEGETEGSSKVMAYLCENPDEVSRIAKLPAARQAAELGKIEARAVQARAPSVEKPKTPAPINPVGSGKSPLKDISRMSADEYYQHRMQQKPVWAR